MQSPRSVLLIGILVSAILAGCLGAPDEGPEPAPTPTGPRGNDRLPLEDLPTGTAEEWNATLAASPEWRLGQWWTYRVTDGFVNDVYETTVVVAGAEPDWFLTGMPRDEFDHALMVLHVPGIGQVRKSDLAWELHDNLFTPIRFPVELGDSWETMWQTQDVVATVVEVEANTATVSVSPADNEDAVTLELTYDADVGTFTKLDIGGYALVEVVDHGFEYDGIVTVPHEHTLVFFSVRAAVAGDLNYGTINGAGAPVETVNVGADFDRVSFGMFAVSLTGAMTPVSPGVYHAQATAPDGTVFEYEMLPEEGPIKIEMHSHLAPGGDWEFLLVAGGPGYVVIEGIAYHVFDINTKTGCLVDADEHAHHGPATEHPDTC